jgi:hypothetical protein
MTKSRIRSTSVIATRSYSSRTAGSKSSVGKKASSFECRLDEVEAGRFERLDEARRQADGDDIGVPEQLASPGHETQPARVGKGLAVQVGEQRVGRFLIAQVRAGIDIAVADAVLERNASLPPGFARDRPRVGREPRAMLARHCDRAIARQPAGPFVIAGLERAFDQQPAKAGTVDERSASSTRPSSSVTEVACPLAPSIAVETTLPSWRTTPRASA